MKKIFFYSLIMLTLVGNVAYAQDTYTLLEPLPCIEGTGNDCKNGDVIPTVSIRDYISYVFKFAIALAVFLATVVIIWAGFEYMWSEIPFVKSNAKGRIQNAVMGLLAALASFLILQTIDPRLVQINTELPMIKIAIDSSTKNFMGQLENDLTQLSAQNKQVVVELDKKMENLEKQRAELIKKIQEGVGDQNQDYIELAKIDQQLRDSRVEQKVLLTIGAVPSFYRRAITDFHKRAEYSANGVPSQLIRDGAAQAKEQIEIMYDKAIKDIDISTDPTLIQKLKFQKEFYIGQIDREQIFMSKAVAYDNTNPKSSNLKLLEPEINRLLDSYKNQKAELAGSTQDPTITKIKGDPILLDQYTTILTDRIKILEDAKAKKQ